MPKYKKIPKLPKLMSPEEYKKARKELLEIFLNAKVQAKERMKNDVL